MNVSKTFSFLAISLAVVFFGTAAVFSTQAQRDEQNYFNTHFRESFSKSPTLRKLFHLNFDGDARADYLGSHYSTVELVGTGEVLSEAATALTKVIGKPVTVSASGTGDKKAAQLFVYFESWDPKSSITLGTTNGARSVIIYVDAIRNYTSSRPYTYDKYVYGTLMHEIGHELGLQHNENPGCLMNTRADEEGEPQFRVDEVITDFCDYEIQLIEKEKNKFK